MPENCIRPSNIASVVVKLRQLSSRRTYRSSTSAFTISPLSWNTFRWSAAARVPGFPRKASSYASLARVMTWTNIHETGVRKRIKNHGHHSPHFHRKNTLIHEAIFSYLPSVHINASAVQHLPEKYHTSLDWVTSQLPFQNEAYWVTSKHGALSFRICLESYSPP